MFNPALAGCERYKSVPLKSFFNSFAKLTENSCIFIFWRNNKIVGGIEMTVAYFYSTIVFPYNSIKRPNQADKKVNFFGACQVVQSRSFQQNISTETWLLSIGSTNDLFPDSGCYLFGEILPTLFKMSWIMNIIDNYLLELFPTRIIIKHPWIKFLYSDRIIVL